MNFGPCCPISILLSPLYFFNAILGMVSVLQILYVSLYLVIHLASLNFCFVCSKTSMNTIETEINAKVHIPVLSVF